PNILSRNFDEGQRKMGADVTEFSVQGKSGTCRQFSDLFNREIISYSLSERSVMEHR
ncbi:IS3 family transposase, partial [Escherichia coli]|nr:IS3 family transposase [Escherichia coli]